ncbi:hypothetical protein MKX36_25005 [Paenibacillus sp. FSL W8-0439]|uniref:hypothetical protein n=1 Tax=Paenibacillus sp. FSL W8-0439 TaxID=2921716 RepID=UPI0030F6DBE7
MITEWKNLISTLKPSEISMYLQTKGWRKVYNYEHNYGSIWRFTSLNEEEVEVILPHNQVLKDYKVRMIELFKSLEVIENRSMGSIINEINLSGVDVLRFRIASNETYSGTMPLIQATSLTKGVENTILAAACSTITPKSYFPRMAYNEARDYLNGCRMGQTERGSYIITVLSPLKAVSYAGSIFSEFEQDEIFERRVLFTLFNSLYHLRTALSNGTEVGIEETISTGVSANLCEALTLMQPENEVGKLEIGVSWAPIRPLQREIPQRKVIFEKSTFSLIKDYVKYLRYTAPIEEFELKGIVKKLDSTDASRGGRVSIITNIENKDRIISFDLPATLYQTAVTAHFNRSLFSCVGTLTKESKGYTLSNVTSVKIENELDFD